MSIKHRAQKRARLHCLMWMLITLFICEESFAQKKVRTKYNTHKHAVKRDKKPFGRKIYNAIGFSVNALNYFGDLTPSHQRISTDLSFTRPGLGLSYIKKRGPRFTIKVEFIYGNIRGEDNNSADRNDLSNGVYRYQRNLSFRNHIKELSVIFMFDLFDNHSFYHSRHKVVPYAYGGVAIFHHSPEGKAPLKDLHGTPLQEGGQWIDLRPLGTEGQYSKLNATDANFGIKPYKLIQPSIPLGVGVRFTINQVADIWIESGLRYMFTDYLDDVSRNYVDLGVLKNQLSQAMSYRTNELMSEVKTISYTGRDGHFYHVVPGYGSEHKDNKRGNRRDNDFIFITTIRVSRIINATMHKAKSR